MLLFCAIPIICAAVTDWKKRIIPDWTWIAILMVGLACAVIGEGISRDVQGILYIPCSKGLRDFCFRQSAFLLLLSNGAVSAGEILS